MELLFQIVIVLGISSVILFICHYIKLPAIVGFLLAGVACGPSGLALVQDHHAVEALAEMGVILLLFAIGLEFSFGELLRLKRTVLAGGGLQVLITILVGFFGARHVAGAGIGPAIFMGFLLALSSTAIVLKIYQERSSLEAPHGRGALSVLIFQDLAVVPMMIIIPILAGAAEDPFRMSLILLAKGGAVIGLVVVAAKWVVPFMLQLVADTRNRELFLLFIVVLCFCVAYLTSLAGLSLALGAFLAGLIVSESVYSHQALSSIMPFKDIFTSLFFVSIGMLLDTRFFFDHYPMIFLTVLSVIAVKGLVMTSVALVLGLPLRTALLIGLALAQIGEFSFILAAEGLEFHILSAFHHQWFLATAVLTMIATPFLITLAPRFSVLVEKLPWPMKIRQGLYATPLPSDSTEEAHLKDHLVIIGFGFNGRNLAMAAREWKIPYTVIEMNPMTVRIEKAKGEPIHFGDASREPILETVHIQQARVAVVAISDPVSTRGITKTVRDMNPDIHLLVRTRFIGEMNVLKTLGASEIIPEEFETSLEILTRVLCRYYVPRPDIEQCVQEIRKTGYEMSRPKTPETLSILDFQLPNVSVIQRPLEPGSSADGHTVNDIGLRKNYLVTLLAIRHADGRIESNPGAETLLHGGDVLLLVGENLHLEKAKALFKAKTDPAINGSEAIRTHHIQARP
jgi:monovalent cation:H+ antiporter-2, CPA2 family